MDEIPIGRDVENVDPFDLGHVQDRENKRNREHSATVVRRCRSCGVTFTLLGKECPYCGGVGDKITGTIGNWNFPPKEDIVRELKYLGHLDSCPTNRAEQATDSHRAVHTNELPDENCGDNQHVEAFPRPLSSEECVTALEPLFRHRYVDYHGLAAEMRYIAKQARQEGALQAVRALAAELGMSLDELREHAVDGGRRLAGRALGLRQEVTAPAPERLTEPDQAWRPRFKWFPAEEERRHAEIKRKILATGISHPPLEPPRSLIVSAKTCHVSDCAPRRPRLIPCYCDLVDELTDTVLKAKERENVPPCAAYRRGKTAKQRRKVLTDTPKYRVQFIVSLWAGTLKRGTDGALSDDAVARIIAVLLPAVTGSKIGRTAILSIFQPVLRKISADQPKPA